MRIVLLSTLLVPKAPVGKVQIDKLQQVGTDFEYWPSETVHDERLGMAHTYDASLAYHYARPEWPHRILKWTSIVHWERIAFHH